MIVDTLRRAAAASLLAMLASCGGGGGGTNYEAIAVLTSNVGIARYGDSLLITLTGRNLDQSFQVRATGCNNLTKSVTAPNVSNDTTAYFTCVPAVSTPIRFQAQRISDGVLLADLPFTATDIPTVTSTEVSSPVRYGERVLITMTGTHLNPSQLSLPARAQGCNSLARSTTAPHISTDTTAYFTCVPAVSTSIRFQVQIDSASALLADVPFTATGLPTVAGAEVGNPVRFGEQVVITVRGTNLNPPDLTLPARATGCSDLALSTTAPNVSTDTTAYFTCKPAVSSTIRFQIQLETGGALLADLPFTVVVPTVDSAELSSPVFIGEPLLITLRGTELQQQLNVTSTGCGAIRKSTIEPHVSTDTTAYYRCVPTTAGATTIVVKRVQDDVEVTSIPLTVPAEVPPAEVTLTVDNGAGVSGNIVITLEPAKAPITVGNFLEYVKDGYYKDVVFHRFVPDFVIQGGGYTKTLDPTSTTAPTVKPNYGGITLEDNAGLLNLKNTISMARTSSPNTGNSQFFFNLKDNPSLNRTSDTQRGYAVFGTITAGAEVLTAMTAAPCVAWPTLFGNPGDGTCLPSPNLVITNAVRTR